MDAEVPAAWEMWRPIRRYYLWDYQGVEPARIRILVPEKTLELNGTASWIWEGLDGSRLVYHLIEGLRENLPQTPRPRIARDVFTLLLSWQIEKLIYLHWEHLQ